MTVAWELHYDRCVSSEFLSAFKPDGPARFLVEIAKYAPFPLDFQLRHDAKTGHEHASLYVGLTDVLKVELSKVGELRLSAHPTWSDTAGKLKNEDFGFRQSWRQSIASNEWAAVEDYLEKVLPVATQKHASQEGRVQAAVSTFLADTHVVLDRESALHFRDTVTKDRIMKEIVDPVRDALSGLGGVKGLPKTKFGGKSDLLALDAEGRVLAIEVKPRNVGTIRWAAAQATVYARLFQRWLERPDLPRAPRDVLIGEWQQRHELDLCGSVDSRLSAKPRVVPIVVVQRGTRRGLIEEFKVVQDRLCDAGVGYPDLRLWEVGMTGRPHEIAL
jgi:hypothetical protein